MIHHPHPTLPRRCEKIKISAVTPVKTGVQSIAKAVKTLDSGFRRNDVKKNQIDIFTPPPSKWEGIYYENFKGACWS
jgi:hypothetical protein